MPLLKFPFHSAEKTVFLLSLLTVGFDLATPSCTNRRCLAQMLVKKESLSQPQENNCTHLIFVPFLEYQTLSVVSNSVDALPNHLSFHQDTKNLRLITRLQAVLVWKDPELTWNTSEYQVDEVILPVNKIWTPEIHVTNGIIATMEHSSKDLLVYSNGTVKHTVVINAEVNCEVNLFNYPFAADECPVAIQAWSTDGCGTKLALGFLKMVDGAHGDWETNDVDFQKKRDDRNYIMVSLRIKPTNPFITLLLPSMLIILADMVSFALPLGGGERNSFKVTLVLSFTLFLNILNDQLPGDSSCSPIIRTHFCICLILLVLSMLVSLLLTRVAQDGSLIFCCSFNGPHSKNKKSKEDKQDEVLTEAKADISVVQLDTSEESTQMLRKVVSFLEGLDAKEAENERHQWVANLLDKIFFWFYFILGTVYLCAMTTVMAKYQCKVDHFDFWYDENY